MDWDAERRLILHPDNIGLDPDEARYADLILTACQAAMAGPGTPIATLDRIACYDGQLLDDIGTAIMAVPVLERTRRATLYGALKMAKAYLWQTVSPDTG